MNKQLPKEIARSYIEMWNTGDASLADALLHPLYRDHGHPEISSAEDVKQALQKTRAAFPDFFITIESMISEGDLVALHNTISRTHHGEELLSHVIMFIHIVDGKMIDLWTGIETRGAK